MQHVWIYPNADGTRYVRLDTGSEFIKFSILPALMGELREAINLFEQSEATRRLAPEPKCSFGRCRKKERHVYKVQE